MIPDKTAHSETKETYRLPLRIPDILRSRIERAVEQKRSEYSRYSTTDFILEAIREKLDGKPVSKVGSDSCEPGISQSLFKTASKPGFGIDPAQFLSNLKTKKRLPNWRSVEERLRQMEQDEAAVEVKRLTSKMLDEYGLVLDGDFWKQSPQARTKWIEEVESA